MVKKIKRFGATKKKNNDTPELEGDGLEVEKAKKGAVTKKQEKEKQQLLREYELEQKFCEVKRICKKWEKFLAEVKRTNISEELKELHETVTQYQETKTEIARLILEEFEEISDCRWKLAATSISSLDQLLEIGMKRQEYLRAQFDTKVDGRVVNFKKELLSAEEKEHRARENLQLTIFQQNELKYNSFKLAKENHDDEILGLRSEIWMETDKIQREVDETIEWIIAEMQTRIKTFLYFTKSKREQVEFLRGKDNAFLLLRNKDFTKCKMLRAEVRALKMKLEEAEAQKVKVENAKEEKRQLLKKYKSLQDVMKENQSEDRKKLKLLSVLSDAAIKNLQAKYCTLMRILRLKEHCRLFESENEYSTSRHHTFKGITAGKGMSLDGFFVHIGKIELDCHERKMELDFLKGENVNLKNILSGHFHALKRGALHD